MVNKVYVGVAVTTALTVLITVRRRRRNKARRSEEPKAIFHATSCGLSVLVDPAKLTDGWAVAPPLFYAPCYAVMPIIHNTDSEGAPASPRVNNVGHQCDQSAHGECGFLLCDTSDVGSLSDVKAGNGPTYEERLRWFCKTNPVLSGFALDASKALTPLTADYSVCDEAQPPSQSNPTTATVTLASSDTTAPQDTPLPFTHRVETDSVLAFLGTNGLYYHAAVFFRGEVADSGASVEASARTVLSACSLAPLAATKARVDELRAPSPAGAGLGAYHVYYLYKAKLIHFISPSSVRVKHLHTTTDKSQCLFTYSVRRSLGAGAVEIPVTPAVLDRVVASAKLNDALPLSTFTRTQDTLSGSAKETWEDCVTSAVTVKVEEGARLSEREGLTVLYQQPSLGAFFSVQPGGEVFDPFMTDAPRIWYYPLGRKSDDQPSLTLHRVSPLPSTWESTDQGDDVFVHNVIFHLTEWDQARTACSFAEVSGARCAQFQEEKEGRCCRTYVVPRKDSLLLIRWETSVADWDGLLPTLQFFIDTLHLDA